MAVRPINASRFAEILEQWKKDCLEANDQQSADVISDVILQLDDMPTLTPPDEWVSVEERLPEPGERVLAAKGTFVGEAYLASNGAWMRHDGFPWEVDAWMPLPAPPGKGNNVPTNEPLTIEQLREMDGRPVYLIVDDGYEPLEMWALIDVPEKDHIVLINNIGGRSAYYSDDDLERDHITVYRRPPEGEEGDADRG